MPRWRKSIQAFKKRRPSAGETEARARELVRPGASAATFRYGRPDYASMLKQATAQVDMFDEFPEDQQVPCDEAVCGV